MKHLIKTGKIKTLFTVSLFSLLFVLVLSSCKKDSTNDNTVAAVMAVNAASSSAEGQDVYINNVKINGSALFYSQKTDYVTVTNGNNVQFRTAGTATVNASAAVYFAHNQKYTLYYTDDKSIIYSANDFNPPSSGKAKVRFLNLSQALNAKADVAISGGAKIVSDLAYKAGSAYSEVNAATTFSLYAAGSSSVLLSLPTTIQAGKIYTIYFSGTTNATINYQVVAEN